MNKTTKDILKRIKKINREQNLQNGFKSINKIFKNIKKYNRKIKHKKNDKTRWHEAN